MASGRDSRYAGLHTDDALAFRARTGGGRTRTDTQGRPVPVPEHGVRSPGDLGASTAPAAQSRAAHRLDIHAAADGRTARASGGPERARASLDARGTRIAGIRRESHRMAGDEGRHGRTS